MKCMSTTNPERQRGFSLASAIFLLVILASLGAFIVSLSGNQQLGLAQDVSGTRALAAARAGLEWGVCMMVPESGSTTTFCATHGAAPAVAFYTGCTGVAASSTTTLAAGSFPGLPEFTVKVDCARTCVDEGASCPGGSSNIYQITATACNSATCPDVAAPGMLYVERRVTSLVEF